MDTLLNVPYEGLMEAVYRKLDYSYLEAVDPDILDKYESLSETNKAAVDNLVLNLTQNREHMGHNFHQVIKQYKNTSPEITMTTFAKFLEEFDDDIMQNTTAGDDVITYMERKNDIKNLFQIGTMMPYFRADTDKLSKGSNNKKNSKYVFMEIICLYLGIDLSVIFYGKGKSYKLQNIGSNDPEALIYTWQDFAEKCDSDYKTALALNKKVDIFHLPRVDFQEVYKKTFGVKAKESYTVVRSKGAPGLLTEVPAKAVTNLILDLVSTDIEEH